MAEAGAHGERVRLVVPDLVSNSYFPAVAAVGLGFTRDEGIDVGVELLYPVTKAARALQAGEITFLAGAAHAPGHLTSGWQDTELLLALAQRVYWSLVVSPEHRSDGGLESLRDLTIAAAPGPDLALVELLTEAGGAPNERGIRLVPLPATQGTQTSFGVSAAQALADGAVDAFWANGMGARVAVLRGAGEILYDARRDEVRRPTCTFPALMTHAQTAAERPHLVSSMMRAVIRAQQALAEDPALAEDVAAEYFPAFEAGQLRPLIESDASYYDPRIDQRAVDELRALLLHAGLEPMSDDQAARVLDRQLEVAELAGHPAGMEERGR